LRRYLSDIKSVLSIQGSKHLLPFLHTTKHQSTLSKLLRVLSHASVGAFMLKEVCHSSV
jgi:hypothetical protein